MTSSLVSTGVELEYETFGSPDNAALLLIAGFGAQLLSWHADLCQILADQGRYVIRFDNRDAGKSTIFDQYAVDLHAIIAAASTGDLDTVRASAPYSLHDMADDVVGLMDVLDVRKAHIVGASMGGMIAQLVAIRHPERTQTLTSMMSSTGEADYGQATPDAMTALLSPLPADRSSYIEASAKATRVWSSRRYFDAEAVAGLAAASYDRSFNPAGTTRQLAALLATGSLADQLTELAVPTLVIHGLDDTLVTPSGGQRTADLIPHADLLLVPDMGHDRPEPLWPLLSQALIKHTQPKQ